MNDARGPWVMWATCAAGAIACLALGIGAYLLANYSWAQVVDYSSPYVSRNAPSELVSTEPTPAAPVVRRVVLVIVDGLREDVSRSSMRTLNRLREYGGDFTFTVPQPSLSYPNWTTILSGASPGISGVTTNWHTNRQYAPTLIDTVHAAGESVVVAGPTDFEGLFGVKPGRGVSLRPWPTPAEYRSAQIVDDAIRLTRESSPTLVVVHLPDVDEAGHAFGGDSARYRQVAARVDADIARLVAGLQGDGTTFVITADHGHIDAGGHGGWESVAITVPGIFVGSGTRISAGTGRLQQVAPTVSVLLGLPDPAYAEDQALRSVLATSDEALFGADGAHHIAFAQHYIAVVTGTAPAEQQLFDAGGPDAAMAAARDDRLAREQAERFIPYLAVLLAFVVVVAIIGVASWRALLAGVAGTAVYFGVYETLYFAVHRYQWSLSALGSDTNVKTFMDWRLGEAAVAALLGVAVAAAIYPLFRRFPKGPQDRRYLPGYLALGPSTLLLVLATLGVQVAWYWWQWGATVTWTLPDLTWAFKCDLDLLQMTAVGLAVVLAPLVAYLVGRYHPKVRGTAA